MGRYFVFALGTVALVLAASVVAGCGGKKGAPPDSSSDLPAISADGRVVAFRSYTSDLAAGDTSNLGDLFVRERTAETTELVNVGSSGTQLTEHSGSRPAISADGRFVAFQSDASNLVAGDSNDWTDVFVRDRVTGTTVLVQTRLGILP